MSCRLLLSWAPAATYAGRCMVPLYSVIHLFSVLFLPLSFLHPSNFYDIFFITSYCVLLMIVSFLMLEDNRSNFTLQGLRFLCLFISELTK